MIQLRKESKEKEFFKLDLAPMINIVFLLLIFFLLTSSAIKQGNAVDLPQAESADFKAGKEIVISLAKDHPLQLDRREISLDGLSKSLTAALKTGNDNVVTIEADKKIEFDRVAEIIDIAKQAGAVDFILATEPND